MSLFSSTLIIIGRSITILLQAAMGMIILFIFSIIFPNVNIFTRQGWIGVIIFIWLGFTCGITLIGWLSISLATSIYPKKYRARLIFTALGVLLPLLILLAIGLSIEPGGEESEFYSRIINDLQPKLSILALVLGIIGFYIPEWIRPKDNLPVNDH